MKTRKSPAMYSRSMRRQLLSADMAYALILLYKDMLNNPPNDIMKIIDECNKSVQKIYFKLYGGGTLVLKNRNLRHYRKMLLELQKSIDVILGKNSKLTLDFIIGIIIICSDQYQDVKKYSKDKEYQQTWMDLVSQLQLIYEYYDKDLEIHDFNENGEKINEAFQRIVNDTDSKK